MPLSWNEIKYRAIAFSKDWRDETREDAEAKSFWDAFFNVFGVPRRTVASFEEPVKKLSGDWAYIDLLWPGTLLAEHKSAGKDLGKAHAQGMAYIRALVDSGRTKEVPRYLIVSDFQRLAIHDLEPEQGMRSLPIKHLPPSFEFPLGDFHKHIRHFAFLAGYKQHRLDPEDPANEEATQLMCDLHDALEAGEYGTDAKGRAGHELKQFLVRLLFCLFAEDNGIFPTRAFQLYLEDHTAPDGSDLGPKLGQLFDVLNTEEDRRQKHLDPDLVQFPYINGQLYAERLTLPAFTTTMRKKLLACCAFDWSRISPAVFGSLFQAVMDSKERREIGAHYTAERNILKVIRALFLDGLRAEFVHLKALKIGRAQRLADFQRKLASLRFLDPACGCGNFLVITYRELRALELEILVALHGNQQEMTLDEVNKLSLLDVDQMYGLEIEEFPARIAETALWLTDHQANVALGLVFTQNYLRIPLSKSPHIHVANALRKDWREVLAPAKCSYVLGNPPFIGSKLLSQVQKDDVRLVFGDADCVGVLDYVACWYRLCVRYCANTSIRCALVSTNSITQGEQVSALWPPLFADGLKIHFAHRTFQWESEARGKAHVHCVIIGFGLTDNTDKTLFEYPTPRGEPQPRSVTRINCYLVDAANIALPPRMTPICNVKAMVNGSVPADGGHLLLTEAERKQLLEEHPEATPFVREYIGADGLINGNERYCLWLAECSPNVIRGIPFILHRLELVKAERLASTKKATAKKAQIPSLFTEDRQPKVGRYLALPRTSSENRRYIPIAYLPCEVIAANDIQMVPDASIFDFGILTSSMHMAWMSTVTGRLKSDYRYSSKIVYNNFPWPESPTPAQRAAVEKAAQQVLAARAAFPKATLADLYDQVAMPPALVEAHAALDKAVANCYRKDAFPSDRACVEYLFAKYEKLSAPIALASKSKSKRPVRSAGPTI